MLTVGCSDHHVNEPWTPCINKKNPKTAIDGRFEVKLIPSLVFLIAFVPVPQRVKSL